MNIQRPRFVPDFELPPYTYVPGHHPHPEKDQEGHMYDETNQGDPDPLYLDRWKNSRTYLMGVDLFNHGYYWESHEKWESLWHLAGRTGETAFFLKGLIKLSAAGVKVRSGNKRGIERHGNRGAQIFSRIREEYNRETAGGLLLEDLIHICETVAEKNIIEAANPEQDVEIVFPFVLEPEEVHHRE